MMQPGLQSGGGGSKGAWVSAPEQGPRILFLSMAAGWDVFSTFRASSAFSLIRPHDVSKPGISSIATIILQITCCIALFSCQGGLLASQPRSSDPCGFSRWLPSTLTSLPVQLRSIKKKILVQTSVLKYSGGLLCTIFGQSRIQVHFSFKRVCIWQPTGGTSRQRYVSLPSAITGIWKPASGETLWQRTSAKKGCKKNWTSIQFILAFTVFLSRGEQRVEVKSRLAWVQSAKTHLCCCF